MDRKRMILQTIFLNIMQKYGINGHVYFQPPASIRIEYPAIIYRRSKIQNDHADDIKYKKYTQYEVTFVSFDPDSEILNDILELDYCEHNRHYASDNLNHDVFTLYY